MDTAGGKTIDGFYWLIDGVLAGCGRPGKHGQRAGGGADATTSALAADLAWLCGQGIGAVLSLTEEPLTAGALAQHELAELHLPVDDLHPPTPAQLDQALAFIDRQRALGKAVAVHCLMGQGRTGTVLAAYLIRGGLSAEVALQELRIVCPGAVENREQERALQAFAARRDWLL